MAAVAIFFAAIAIYNFIQKNKTPDTPHYRQPPATENTSPTEIPEFKKEGELTFLDAKQETEIITIDIEIADNEQERMQGLMYRESMPDSAGMLFIFPYEQPRSFWMKNTKISLDILYVDSNGKIVSIHKNTTPFSEKTLPSFQAARYVVEVNAGFTEKHDIAFGDYIKF